jgi:hypothetical protein
MLGYTSDFYSTLLHEGFHLASTSSSGENIKDRYLYNAMFGIQGIEVRDSLSHSEAIGATFAKYCRQ